MQQCDGDGHGGKRNGCWKGVDMVGMVVNIW